MAKTWANSGDSHVLEPDGIWHELPDRLRSRAPRSEQADGREIVFIDDEVVRRDPLAWVESFRPPGARDLTARMEDLNEQGIWAECVFPSMGIWVTLIKDPELYAHCARAYNGWLADTVNGHSDRLVGAAILPHLDTQDAVDELYRCAALGFKTVSLAMSAPSDRTYNHDLWEPLWAAAEEIGMPICFHAGTGAPANNPRGPGAAILNYVEVGLGAQRTVTEMVSGGALDRHPGLKIFMVEVGAAWLPALGDRMDEAYRQHGFFTKPKLESLPGELIRRQVYASFQHDASAVAAVEHMGFTNVLWGSDYPHLEGTFPHTQKVLHDLFDGVNPQVRDRITIEAFNELFGLTQLPPQDETGAGAS